MADEQMEAFARQNLQNEQTQTEFSSVKEYTAFGDTAKKIAEQLEKESTQATEPVVEAKVETEVKPTENGGLENQVEVKTEVVNTEVKPTEVVETTEKSWYDDDFEETTSSVESTKVEKPTEVEDYKSKYDEVKSRAEQLEQIMQDDLIQSYLNTKAAGKDITEFFENLKPINAKALSDEDLIKHEARVLEIELSESDLERELEGLSSMSPIQRKHRLDSIRNQIEAENSEKLKRYNEGVRRQAIEKQQAVNNAVSELNTKINSLKDANLFGLKITPEIAEGIKNYILKEIPSQDLLLKQDGTYNIDAMIDLAIYRKHLKTLVKSNVNQAINKGRKEVLQSVTNPSANNTGSNRVVELPKEDDGFDDAAKAFSERAQLKY